MNQWPELSNLISAVKVVAKNSFRQQNAHPITLVLGVVKPLVQTLGFIYFFSYLAKPAGGQAAATSSMLAYYAFIAVIMAFDLSRYSDEMQKDIITEHYLTIDQLPIHPFVYYFSDSIGRFGIAAITMLLLSLGYLVASHTPLLFMLLFMVAAAVAIVLSHLLFFLAGCVSFYAETFRIWLFSFALQFLSGRLIPFPYLPRAFVVILSILPLAYIGGAFAAPLSQHQLGALLLSFLLASIWLWLCFRASERLWRAGGNYFQEHG